MAKEDIIGGIRIALSKGQKLEDAMQSFYNAGYKKEDIEQAVSELFSETSQSVPQQYPQPIQIPQIQKPVEVPKQQQIQQTSVSQPVQQPRIVQQTSQTSQPTQQQYRQPIQQQKPQISQPQLTTQVQQPQQTKPGSNSFPTLEEIQKRYQSLAPPSTLSQKKQIVSNYENEKKMDAITIMLIFILALLFGVLAAVFIFRKQIVEVLNNLL